MGPPASTPSQPLTGCALKRERVIRRRPLDDAAIVSPSARLSIKKRRPLCLMEDMVADDDTMSMSSDVTACTEAWTPS